MKTSIPPAPWVALVAAFLLPAATWADTTLSKLAGERAYDGSFGVEPSAPVLAADGKAYWTDFPNANDDTGGKKLMCSSGGQLFLDPQTPPTDDAEDEDLPLGFVVDAVGTSVLLQGTLAEPAPSGIGRSNTGALYQYSGGITRVADRHSTFPGMTGAAQFSGVSAGTYDSSGIPVLHFRQQSSPQVQGIFHGSGTFTAVARSADTDFPGGGKFTRIENPIASGDWVYFYGENGGTRGVYQIPTGGGTATVVADNTAALVSGGSAPTIGGSGDVTFAGDDDDVAVGLSNGVYKRVSGVWSRVAAQFGSIPSGTGTFYAFPAVAIRNGKVAFQGGRDLSFAPPTEDGLYTDANGPLARVVDLNSDFGALTGERFQVAGGGRWWTGGTDFVFAVEGNGKRAIYRASVAPAVLTAVDDDFLIRTAAAVAVPVLLNDIAPPSGLLRVTAVTQGAKGKVTLARGRVTYNPGANFDGTDSFTYTVTGDGADTSTATVTVTNPFFPLSGSFSQLVTADGAALGLLTAKLSSAGSVSGKVTIGGKAYNLHGLAGFDGSFTQKFRRNPAGTPDLVVKLSFTEDNQVAQVSGNITGEAAPVSIAAGKVELTSLPAAILEGAYTMFLPTDGEAANPRGTGWAKATLSDTGKLTLTGRLGDDTAFSATTALSSGGTAVLFVPLYKAPEGELAGTLQLTGSGAHTLIGGTLAWRKPVQTHATAPFAAGFFATTVVNGADYVAPARDIRALTYTDPANAKADMEIAGAGVVTIDAAVTVSTADKIAAELPNPSGVIAKLTRTTGLLSGSFLPAAGAKARKFTGIVNQVENRGAGFHPGTDQTGTITFVPR
ncbi:MAG: hypothetical protein QOD99_1400 [Chthoniobacter sp.]|nr:hypothetical protein [Chthoniobacter sp.]